MIGNDLIDIQWAKSQSNWQRKGFLEKQFADTEIVEILSSENPFLQVWLFWSMKEAAYKCYAKEFQKRFFAPKKFVCTMIDKNTGIVSIDQHRYFSKSEIAPMFIHTVSQKNEVEISTSEMFLMNEKVNQTLFVQQQILAKFSKADAIQKNELGIPFLYQKDKKLALSISISHHGKFGAFVVL